MNKICALTNPGDFERVYKSSRWSGTSAIGIKSCINGQNLSRFGLVVGKRIGGAVQRNLVKRRLREIIRQLDIKKGMDILIVARTGVTSAGFTDLKNTVSSALKKTDLLMENE